MKGKITPKTYNTEENPKAFDHVQKINARLYMLMFKAYYRVAELKESFDTFISHGKKYYKDYKINAKICFETEEDEKPAVFEGENFCYAEYEWKISTTYGRKMSSKMKALDLWKNYQFAFPEGLSFYFCRAMYDFVFPKKEKGGYYFPVWHRLPDEIITKLNIDDFFVDVTVTIGQKTLKQESISWLEHENYKERLLHRYDEDFKETFSERIRYKFAKNPILFRKTRMLYIAKKLLKLELQSESIRKKIERDFTELKNQKGKYCPSLDRIYSSLTYNYHYLPRHYLGIKTKYERMREIEISAMTSDISLEHLDLGDKYILNWDECCRLIPFTNHYLCFSFHNVWQHCDLTFREFLNLRMRNFKVAYDLNFQFADGEKENEAFSQSKSRIAR